MKLEDVIAMAKLQGINPGNLAKTELIKSIQTIEGNFDCFGTARNGECDQVNCCWREDCFKATE